MYVVRVAVEVHPVDLSKHRNNHDVDDSISYDIRALRSLVTRTTTVYRHNGVPHKRSEFWFSMS